MRIGILFIHSLSIEILSLQLIRSHLLLQLICGFQFTGLVQAWVLVDLPHWMNLHEIPDFARYTLCNDFDNIKTIRHDFMWMSVWH